MASSPQFLHFSNPSICLLLSRAPLSAHEFLPLTHSPASPTHLWQLLIHSQAPLTCSIPRWFCQSISGTSTAHTQSTELREEVQRQSGCSRSPFKLLLSSSWCRQPQPGMSRPVAECPEELSEAGLSPLCTQLREFQLLEGREGSYFCNMPWQSLLMHTAHCPRRQEIYLKLGSELWTVIHIKFYPVCTSSLVQREDEAGGFRDAGEVSFQAGCAPTQGCSQPRHTQGAPAVPLVGWAVSGPQAQGHT